MQSRKSSAFPKVMKDLEENLVVPDSSGESSGSGSNESSSEKNEKEPGSDEESGEEESSDEEVTFLQNKKTGGSRTDAVNGDKYSIKNKPEAVVPKPEAVAQKTETAKKTETAQKTETIQKTESLNKTEAVPKHEAVHNKQEATLRKNGEEPKSNVKRQLDLDERDPQQPIKRKNVGSAVSDSSRDVASLLKTHTSFWIGMDDHRSVIDIWENHVDDDNRKGFEERLKNLKDSQFTLSLQQTQFVADLTKVVVDTLKKPQ